MDANANIISYRARAAIVARSRAAARLRPNGCVEQRSRICPRDPKSRTRVQSADLGIGHEQDLMNVFISVHLRHGRAYRVALVQCVAVGPFPGHGGDELRLC